jgi:hypothetical protein
VYVTLYQQWGLSIFNNIANSEDRHENKIETLLDNYQISDPVGNNPIGVFVNPDLQQLYNNLVTQGSQSLTEALKVGVLIEETDIVDLQQRIAQTDNADIQQVYEKLLSGSNNHLSAFTSNLTGETGKIDSSDDPLTGGRSNQMLVGNRKGDRLTGELGSDYIVRGVSGSANSDSATDFLLNSPSQINNCQLQGWEQSYPNFEDNFDSQNLANNFATGFYGNQDPIEPLTIMPTNDWNAMALSFDVNF